MDRGPDPYHVPPPPSPWPPMTPDGRLRIMFPASLGKPGGAERQMLLLAQHLPSNRFDVSFVLLGRRSEVSAEAERLGATVHALNAPHRAGTALPIFGALVGRKVLAYVGLCRRERYDIVDAWLYLGYGLAAVTRPFSRVPVLIAGRRSLSAFKDGFGLVERTVDLIARRQADLIVANSAAVAADVATREGIDPARIRVIRNGVELPSLPTDTQRRALRASWGVTDDAPVIGSVGTFKRGKGQARIAGVMRHIHDTSPDAWLVFVGDGPELASVQQFTREVGLDRVRFVGTVQDARTLYAGFDVLVSASEAEGLPNVVLEAAASARPVVATDAGGTSEIVVDGKTGILVPVGDDDALGLALTRLLSDPRLAERLGRGARDLAARAFGLDRFISETADLYVEMADRHGA